MSCSPPPFPPGREVLKSPRVTHAGDRWKRASTENVVYVVTRGHRLLTRGALGLPPVLLQRRRSAVFTGSQAAPITVLAAQQASMFSFIDVAGASCGDGTILGSASEPGEGGQRPGRSGPAASGPRKGVHICFVPWLSLSASASPVSHGNGAITSQHSPGCAPRAKLSVSSEAWGTAAYVAACGDEPPRVF